MATYVGEATFFFCHMSRTCSLLPQYVEVYACGSNVQFIHSLEGHSGWTVYFILHAWAVTCIRVGPKNKAPAVQKGAKWDPNSSQRNEKWEPRGLLNRFGWCQSSQTAFKGEGTSSDMDFWRDFGSQMEPKKNAKVESDLLTIEFRGSSDFVQPYSVFSRFWQLLGNRNYGFCHQFGASEAWRGKMWVAGDVWGELGASGSNLNTPGTGRGEGVREPF